jgi:type I restriction enzyme, S subunit
LVCLGLRIYASPLRSQTEYWGGQIPWYSSGELNHNYTDKPDRTITEDGLDKSTAKLFPKGSLLIGMYDTAALKMSILDRDAAFNQAIAGVKPNPDIDLKFILAAINSAKPEILNQRRGVRQKNLNLTKIKNINIPLPPLHEQKRIVAILDEAFAGISQAVSNAEKNLANARELFESYLNSIFTQKGDGWVDKPLSSTCIVERGSSPRPIKNFITDDPDGVNWIKIGDTKEVVKFIYSTKQKITKEGATRSRKVNPGDFILTNSMSFGKPYIMATTGYIHDGWFVLRLEKDINTDFFYYLLGARIVQDQFHSLAAGAIVKNISGDLVKKAILPIPPLSEQEQLVESIEVLALETQRLEAIYQQKFTALTELKQSILQKAFTGELTADSIQQQVSV